MNRYLYDPADRSPNAATVAVLVLLGIVLTAAFLAAYR